MILSGTSRTPEEIPMTTTHSAHTPAAPYRDRKRYAWLLSVIAPLGAPAGPILYMQTGETFWLWLFLAGFYFGTTALDMLFGEDRSNPPESAVPRLEADSTTVTSPGRWCRCCGSDFCSM
jgi:hypothetical protein